MTISILRQERATQRVPRPFNRAANVEEAAEMLLKIFQQTWAKITQETLEASIRRYRNTETPVSVGGVDFFFFDEA